MKATCSLFCRGEKRLIVEVGYGSLENKGRGTCDGIIPDDSCRFVARFPHFSCNEHGDQGDEGSLCLQADNGRFLRVEGGDGGPLLADVASLDEAENTWGWFC